MENNHEIEILDLILQTLPPAPGNYSGPLGLHSAIILPDSELIRAEKPFIQWKLELINNGHIIKKRDNLSSPAALPFIKRTFIMLGYEIKKMIDFEKAIQKLHFSTINIDIIVTDKDRVVVDILGFTDPFEFENGPPTSRYYPKNYRHKKSPLN